MKKFPKGFLWGTATSAHQVEGGNRWSDWYLFEKEGKVEGGEQSGKGCDHYNLYKEDINLAKKLHQNAQRISIEWSRIEKEPGKFDKKEFEHYRHELTELKKAGFTTFVTLHHFTNPIWFVALGGWEKKENVRYFTEYAEKAVRELGDLVDFWTTFNEPVFPYAANGWLTGIWPPQKQNPFLFAAVVQNLIKAHKETYQAIKAIENKANVGIVYNVSTYFNKYETEKFAIKPFNFVRNWYFLDRINNYSDYIGVNYYFPIRFFKLEGPRSDMDWAIDPNGFYDALKTTSERYNKPIYVTENGIANECDDLRSSFIISHIKAMHRAISEGADVRGYFHWSLLDNFEWKEGYQASSDYMRLILRIAKEAHGRVPQSMPRLQKITAFNLDFLALSWYYLCYSSK